MSQDGDLLKARSRLIFALDVPTLGEAAVLLDCLRGKVGMIKVGLELFTACGPSAVEEVTKRGFDVFLDLKLHDIPNTVAGAVRAAKRLGVSMLTLHTGGARAMLESAVDAAAGDIRLLGVTLLTSIGSEDLEAVAIAGTPHEVVMKRARLAATAGLAGIVCSPKETANARSVIGDNLIIVTPGIRPSGTAAQDQKRAATPASAIGDGADFLVVGRPIGASADPVAAADGIISEIAAALAHR